jgi:hypothetical protein
MAAGNTYEAIATTTLSSTATDVTFSSISGSYTDLVLVCYLSDNSNNQLAIQVGNGSLDTGSNYSAIRVNGTGTSATSNRSTSIAYIYPGITGTAFGTHIFNFMNYSNTTTNKTVLSRVSQSDYFVTASVGLWRSTSAINTIKVYGGTWQIGSTFSLYGIAAA